jgi:Raf kinase inhibitor-like YbhB/YbcL family protein
LAIGALPLVAGCGGSDEGRTLQAPSPDQTTTTTLAAATSETVTTGVDAGSATGDGAAATQLPEAMALTSPTIVEGGEIPAANTCRGADVSPALQWTPAPVGTVELAVVVRDLDAGGFVHWVIAGMSPTTGGLAEATAPTGAVEATNEFGRPGWAGPCPPEGTHTYDIRVYALSQPSGVTAGQPGAEAAIQVEATPAVMSAVLSGWARAG